MPPVVKIVPGSGQLLTFVCSSLLLAAGCATGPADEQVADRESTAEPGTRLFHNYCAACHQDDAQSVGEAPPLYESPWVMGPEERLIKIVLHGVRGRLEVQGETYDREMPGFGAVLSDEEVASLLSFVRARFGSPSSPVAPEVVRSVREAHSGRTAYWDIDELAAKDSDPEEAAAASASPPKR